MGAYYIFVKVGVSKDKLTHSSNYDKTCIDFLSLDNLYCFLWLQKTNLLYLTYI
jgi:hypothetical protein